jgi:hypothetical protein
MDTGEPESRLPVEAGRLRQEASGMCVHQRREQLARS